MKALRALLWTFLLISIDCHSEPASVTFTTRDLGASAPLPMDALRTVEADAARTVEATPRADAATQAASPQTGNELAAECMSANDCEVVRAGCCGCSGGGKHKALAKSQRPAYEKRQLSRCGAHSICPAVMSMHQSCQMNAGCRAGRCMLVLRRGEE